MSGMLVWAVILFLAGLAFLILEAFIPSGGLLGILALACLATSIVLGYLGSWVEGTVILAITVIGVPVAVALMLKYWPDTPIGRKVLLNVPGSDEVLPDTASRKALIGKRGRAQSVMLPSGPVEIDGELIDAVSRGMTIEAGQLVEVVEAGALHVVVRAIEEDEPAPTMQASEQDLLSEPIESLGLDRVETEDEELSAEPIADPVDETRLPDDLSQDVFSREVLLEDEEDDENDSELETR
ncbi:MAG: hypothetical protein MPJ50_03760 [Pirellulales bacterium]|nr:hypothetical protein [Pirellulales bacterium]